MRPAAFHALVAAALLAGAAAVAGAEVSRHAGYYYPLPQTHEVYRARTRPLPDANRRRRVLFVSQITQQMLGGSYAPRYALFAKGDEAEKLILTSLEDGVFDTLYRMRGLLAMLSAVARGTPIFRDTGIEESLTFFDFLRLLGFEQITVTDGDRFAHQVRFE